MKPQEFEQLMEKFLDGTTSESEEIMLKDFLQKQTLPDEYKELKMYFQAMEVSELALNDDFDKRLLSKISSLEKTRKLVPAWLYSMSAVAATILIFLVIWFGTDLFQPKQLYGTVTDPKIALEITQEALQQVSFKMNAGLKPADKTIKKVDKSMKDVSQVKKIDQALNDARKMQEIEKASQLLKSVSKVYVHVGNS